MGTHIFSLNSYCIIKYRYTPIYVYKYGFLLYNSLDPFSDFCDIKFYIKVPKIHAVVFHPLAYLFKRMKIL